MNSAGHSLHKTQENEFLPKVLNHKSVILLCNNCDNRPYTNICPTKAT